jgi:hypothetical protein
MHEDRKLDWVPRFDPRSRAFPLRALVPEPVERRTKRWTAGPRLDQGPDGACVGFGWTGELLATPVKVDLERVATLVPRDPHQFAHNVYREAQKIDEWEGESYDGTSVLAGAKVLKRYNLMSEYHWAFNINQVIDALILRGPVVLGLWWYSGMFDAYGGVLKPSGFQVGGHCVLATGYIKNSERFAGKPSVQILNSWGPTWGINGMAEIDVDDLGDLLRDEGEACVPSRRHYGRTALV